MANKKNPLIVKLDNTALAPIIDYGDDFGAGVDDIGRDEAGIPFLKILQAQSPEVIGPDGKIAGAVAGLILNTGTEELLTDVTIVPALRQHVYVEWRGKSPINTFQPGTPMVEAAIAENARAIEAGEPSKKKQGKMKFGEFYTPEGNELAETFYVYAVILENDVPSGLVVIPFASTQIKKYSKKFINRVRYCMVDDGTGHKRNPPMFAHRVNLATEDESNPDGTWKGYAIQFAVDNNVQQSLMEPDHAGYKAGREFRAMIEGGEVKADLSKAATTDAGEEDGGSAF